MNKMFYFFYIFLLLDNICSTWTRQFLKEDINKQIIKGNIHKIHHSKYKVRNLKNNNVDENLKKIEDLHNHIKNNGHKLNNNNYNKLIGEYKDLINIYNGFRRKYSSVLPPLWSLVAKPILIPYEKNCDEWFYIGREAGLFYSTTLKVWGKFENWNDDIKKKLNCNERTIYQNREDKAFKDCFFRGYYNQLRDTFHLIKNDEPLLVDNPYKNKDMVRKIMQNIKK